MTEAIDTRRHVVAHSFERGPSVTVCVFRFTTRLDPTINPKTRSKNDDRPVKARPNERGGARCCAQRNQFTLKGARPEECLFSYDSFGTPY
jgi:hypothetical protein